MHVGIHFWSNKKNKNASNKENVYIKGSVHDAYLELPSSGTLKIKRLQSQIIYRCGSNKTNGPKLDSQNRLRSHMPERENRSFINNYII
jgi:hypothetical protein